MNEFEEKVVYEAIKDELKKFRNNSLYRCPHCEKIIEWNDANYNPEESTFTLALYVGKLLMKMSYKA